VTEDDADLSEEAVSLERIAAAHNQTLELAAENRVHLNAVAESVFASHAGEPIAEVLIELVDRANTNVRHVSAEALVDAANAISLGRHFAFV
jgi:hypothetical protein